MIERLWKEQRTIQNWIVPLSAWGRVLTVTMSWLQRITRGLARLQMRGRKQAPR